MPNAFNQALPDITAICKADGSFLDVSRGVLSVRHFVRYPEYINLPKLKLPKKELGTMVIYNAFA